VNLLFSVCDARFVLSARTSSKPAESVCGVLGAVTTSVTSTMSLVSLKETWARTGIDGVCELWRTCFDGSLDEDIPEDVGTFWSGVLPSIPLDVITVVVQYCVFITFPALTSSIAQTPSQFVLSEVCHDSLLLKERVIDTCRANASRATC
jgi:hypothetical protein